ncbi:MAG: hypothetical protein Q8N09_00920 [Thermodesulfovibrionia bacterium]|nr:hypothetical protein [Thermodesulfovibrionia bacterium]
MCIKTERALRNDFTVAHNGKLYQIKDNVKAKKVVVEERIDGSIISKLLKKKLPCVSFKHI